jgi:hypothetical protein
MTPEAPVSKFRCSICAEPSETICCWCTKDACENHICAKCKRCSDCCDCEIGPGGGMRAMHFES